MKCEKCGIARYCSIECQRRDWRRHKKLCERPSDDGGRLEHIENAIETWSLRKIRAAIEGGTINQSEVARVIQCCESCECKEFACCAVTLLAIAVIRGHVMLVKYLIEKGAVCGRDDYVNASRCECTSKITREEVHHVVDIAMQHADRVAFRLAAGYIPLDMFGEYSYNMTLCLEKVMKSPSARIDTYTREVTAQWVEIAARADTVAAIAGAFTTYASVLVENGCARDDKACVNFALARAAMPKPVELAFSHLSDKLTLVDIAKAHTNAVALVTHRSMTRKPSQRGRGGRSRARGDVYLAKVMLNAEEIVTKFEADP